MAIIYEEDKEFRPAYTSFSFFMTAKQVGCHKRDGRPVVRCPRTGRFVVLDWDRAGQPITIENKTGQVDLHTFLAPKHFFRC